MYRLFVAARAMAASGEELRSNWRLSVIAAVRWFWFPTGDTSQDVWALLQVGTSFGEAVGIGLLLRYYQVFNTHLMDNAAPYYKIYDDPYAQANFILGKKAEAMPVNASSQEGLIRWPLADDTSDMQRFVHVLDSFSHLHQLSVSFYCSQVPRLRAIRLYETM
jgi:hypothetical protein